MTSLVLINDIKPGVRELVLNRPDALNAFNQQLCDDLTEALHEADRSAHARVLVLTGTGRAFSSGTDLTELAANGDFRKAGGSVHGFEGMVDSIVSLSKPLICAVNGPAVGFGATILGLADLVVMSSEARIRCPFTQLALNPEAGSSVTFPRLLGRQAASWLFFTSEWMDAEQCHRIGLAWEVVEPDQLLLRASRLAETIAQWDLESLIETKRLLRDGFQSSVIDEARQRESRAFDRLLGRPAQVLAVEEFIQARKQNQ
jgi:enoyl-CoA hydratase/carnithine racemase